MFTIYFTNRIDMTKWVYIIMLILGMVSCKQHEAPYSFFVAGHTYGAPGGTNQGLHPPFLKEFSRLNADSSILFGVLTGDMVRKSDTASWDAVDKELMDLHKKVYFCPGNHDTYNRQLYEDRYGKTFYSFRHEKDLFIVLDGSLDRWNISGEQKDFLLREVEGAKEEINNIFIFIHQLVWWDENNVFSSVKLNWPPYTPDTTNYWSEIEPLLKGASIPVFIFAGDLGASTKASPVMYFVDQNVSYIASGMGSIKDDNYIIVSSMGKGKVNFELRALGGDHARMGLLEDHILSVRK